jgi:hypothetical protein
MQHMKDHLYHIWNITYATYETSLMQHSKYNSHAHAHEWMDDAYAYEMQVQNASLTLGCYSHPLSPWSS